MIVGVDTVVVRHSLGVSLLDMCWTKNHVYTTYFYQSEMRTLLLDVEKVEHLNPAELRQISFITLSYPIPSEIFS